MKVRSDIVKMYKEVHSWVGIISGLCLFIAFYAGAITMFEEPLQRWASAPTNLPPPVSLDRAPELVEKMIAAHPQAAKNYSINVRVDGNQPARASWTERRPGAGRRGGETFYAALDEQDALQVSAQKPSPVADFIDLLHQKIGLPIPRPIAMPIMGVIALLYCIAIVSGVVVLLPSLVKDLYALRLGKNLKRMWLDVHNLLGLFSLPFHIAMAITSVGFAFHDQYYDLQERAFAYRDVEDEHGVHGSGPVLPPGELIKRVERQVPGFEVLRILYAREPSGALETHVAGLYPQYAVRGPVMQMTDVDAYTGEVTEKGFMPGVGGVAGALNRNWIAVHFGNYGGAPIRWSYLLLGLAGAALFYTGNLLWIESRRKKERKAGLPEQTRSTRILGALTVGVPLGCIAGISLTVAAAKLVGPSATEGLHSTIYYAVFCIFILYALARGAARSGVELAGAAAAATLAIPIVSLSAGTRWYENGGSILFDIGAVTIAGTLLLAMRAAYRRSTRGDRDSVWSVPPRKQISVASS